MTSQRGVLTCLPAMPTLTQDPADPFTLLTEQVRRVRRARHGIAAVVLICDLFAHLLRLLASRPGQAPTGKLAHPAPARSKPASPAPQRAPAPPHVPAPGMPPRPSFRLWRWMLGADMSGDQPCSPLQQPDMPPVRAATPRKMPRVKPRLPPRPCVRKSQQSSGLPLPARQQPPVAAQPRSAAATNRQRRVFHAEFAKINIRSAALACPFRCDIATIADFRHP